MTWLDDMTAKVDRVDLGTNPPALDTTLETLCASATSEDALDLRQERAAILEHDGGLTRNEAERKAGLK